MDIIGKVRALVEADTTAFEKSLKTLETTTGAVDKAATKVETSFDRAFKAASKSAEDAEADIKKTWDNIGSGLMGIGAGLSATVTAPLVLAFNNAAGAALGFNTEMANVATMIPGSKDRVDELSAAVVNLSTTTGKTTTDLTGGLYEVISAFGDTADTVAILDINARAATAGISTTREAIALTSAVTKGYGDTSAAAVQQVADLAFQTVALGQTTFPALAASIGRVVPIAETMGVEVQELFGFMATFTGVTGGASEVSTQLNAVLTALMKPTEEMSTAISALGFASGDAMVEQLGLKGAIDLITASAGGNKEKLGDMWGSVEALRLVLPATSAQSQTLADKIGAMATATGAADTAFDEIANGVNANGFAWGQLLAKIDAVWIQFGQALQPAISAMIPVLETLVGYVESAVKWFGSWPAELQLAAVGVGAVLAAIGPLVLAVGGAITAWTALAPAITAVTAVLGPITLAAVALTTAKVALVAAAVALAAALYYPMIEELVTEFGTLTTNISGLASEISTGLGPQLGNLVGFLGDVVTWTAKTAAEFSWMLSPLGLLTEQVKGANAAFAAFKGDTGPLTDAVAANTKAVADNATEMGKAAIEASLVATANRKLTIQQQKTSTATKATTEETKSLKEAQERATKVANFYIDRIQGLDRTYKDVDRTFATVTRSLGELARGYDESTKAIQGLSTNTQSLSNTVMPAYVRGISQMEAAMKALGLTSNVESAKLVADAQAAYDALVASGMATEYQTNSAYLRVLQAMAAESKAVTGQIPIDLQTSIDGLEKVVNGDSGLKKVKAPFERFSSEVSTIVTNLSQDLAKSLFDGDLSFSERGIKALKDLGAAAVAQFTQPFLDALVGPEGLITKGINLLITKLTDVMGLTGSLFGVGTSAASGAAGAAGSAAGAAGQAAGAGTSAAGSAVSAGLSGAMGIVGAIGSVVSAISGIIGNFQMANINQTLDLIEKHVRYSEAFLGDHGGWSIMDNTGWTRTWSHFTLQKIENELIPIMRKVEEQTYWSMKRLDNINTDLLLGVDRIVAAMGSLTVTVVTNLDGKEIARTVTDIQAANAALQGAG